MHRLINNPRPGRNREALSLRFGGGYVKSLWVLLLTGTAILAACGSGSSSGSGTIAVPLAGNWQFSLSNNADVTPLSGLQGGFLQEKNDGSVTGTVAYSVTRAGETVPCNSGSAAITGTISGQTVALTAVAGTQTFTFTGTATTDGTFSKMAGSYTATAGTGSDGNPCGDATTLGWTAASVLTLQGPVAGSFHSTGGAKNLANQDFAVTGFLTQGPNTGADNATVTGSLSFTNYPCFATASVTGTITGDTVVLQLNGGDGKIGAPDTSIVTFESTTNGYVLHSVEGTSYAVSTTGTTACPGSAGSAGDVGYVCLALGNTGACQQPVLLSPASLTFPAQTVGTSSAAQKITLKNNAVGSVTLDGMSLGLTNNPPDATNFAVTSDTCDLPGNSLGSAFSLLAGQVCTIAVTFTPQSTSALKATLTVTTPVSPDNNTAFALPITGTGK